MTTDYRNLSFFDAAAVVMIMVGVSIIGFQIFISLPEQSQADLASAFEVLEMSDAIAEAWQAQLTAHELVFSGMGEFYKEFNVALVETVAPVVEEGTRVSAETYSSVAYSYEAAVDGIIAAANGFVEVSESLASNYQDNYVSPGVEAGVGGKVMGAFVERLSE
jgi:hypothetical protein